MQVSLRAFRLPAARLSVTSHFLHSSASSLSSTTHLSSSTPTSGPPVSPYAKDYSHQLERVARSSKQPRPERRTKYRTELVTNVRQQIAKLKEHRAVTEADIDKIQALIERKFKKKQRKESRKAVARARTGPKLEGAESPSTKKAEFESFWISGWGEDNLSPGVHAAVSDLPPSPGLLNRTRSVEGVVEPSEGTFHLYDLEPPTEQRPIPRLAHNLDRALFNPGVNWLQDPRSRVFNYTPWLSSIPKVQDFDFNRVPGFIKSSMDEDLFRLAKKHGAKFAGSTSSLTGMLSQIYFALSNAKEVDISVLSHTFFNESKSFTPAQRFPTSTVLWYRNGIYSTDSYSYDITSDKNVLTWMGTMLEKFLTLPEPAFKKLLRSSPPPTMPVDQRRETCRYAKVGNYVMRSQLDCQDPRLPGTGVFDIKTRASLPIRIDLLNYEENSGYLIRQMHGLIESFEREYYDLIRSAFLKYSLQARIGNMDGVLVAYHNTSRIFGFQYVPLEEMDERLYGNKHAGPYVFEKCVKLLEIISTEITSHFPEQHIACIWEADSQNGKLFVWAEPLNWSGNAEEKPIVELTMDLKNFIAEKPISGDKVMERVHVHPWLVQYKISRSDDDIPTIRSRQQAALDKQRHVFNLPSGVSVEQMAEVWEAMDFGGGDLETTKSAFSPDRFQAAPPNILALRKLARKGKLEMDTEAQRFVSESRIVWEPTAETSFAEEAPAEEPEDTHVITSGPRKMAAEEVITTLKNIAEGNQKLRQGSHYEPSSDTAAGDKPPAAWAALKALAAAQRQEEALEAREAAQRQVASQETGSPSAQDKETPTSSSQPGNTAHTSPASQATSDFNPSGAQKD